MFKICLICFFLNSFCNNFRVNISSLCMYKSCFDVLAYINTCTIWVCEPECVQTRFFFFSSRAWKMESLGAGPGIERETLINVGHLDFSCFPKDI